MAVPSSGPLELRGDIALEVYGSATGTNISLGAMSDIAGFAAPDAMSDFYGFSFITMTLYLDNYLSTSDTPNYLQVYVNGTLYQATNGTQTSYSVTVPASTSVSFSAFSEYVTSQSAHTLEMYDESNLYESDYGTTPSLSFNYTTPSSNFNMYATAY